MSRVVLAMSGGVDSSVAAHLLLEQGHDVIGVFMRHGEQSPAVCRAEPQEAEPGRVSGPMLPIVSRLDHKQGCCTASDAEDARRVADRLGIPFYALNLQEEFGQIIDYFVAEYSAGRTPNPCVQCNNWIKFGKLFEYAESVGAEYVATGHYARLARSADGSMALLRGLDGAKDQSYVLFGIARSMLARMMLPVGHHEKGAIRSLAAEIGLRVAEKKDSQEICFVTQGRYDEFVRRRREATSEEVDDTSGELGRSELTARDGNWLVEGPASGRCFAQIRYNAPARPARLTILPERRLHVEFEEAQFAVAPGQAVVCFDAETNSRVLGGGWIES